MSVCTKNTNPFSIEMQIKAAREIAERNGFQLEENHCFPGRISLLATKPPYAKDVVIRVFEQWEDVIIYLMWDMSSIK